MVLAKESIDALGKKGPFAQKNSQFYVREAQQQMVGAVAATIEQKKQLVVEAGTGTGKTFAYLVPALLRLHHQADDEQKSKILISTATKSLQDQLFHRDLPYVTKTLGVTVDAVLLKGRANYVCPYRLQLYSEQQALFSFAQHKEIEQIRRWAAKSVSGDISECETVPEHSPAWKSATSTQDNCLGQDCPQLDNCPLYRVRKQAMQADLIVVNHHLFFADVVLKEDAFGELLPECEVMIFDEAHQLPSIATVFYGQKVTSRNLLDLCRDVQAGILESSAELEALSQAQQELANATDALIDRMGLEEVKGIWSQVVNRLQEYVVQAHEKLMVLTENLALEQTRSRGLANCWKRAQELLKLFSQLVSKNNDSTNQVHWYEQYGTHFNIHFTPLSVAELFGQALAAHPAAWIFTSATLAVKENFAHFTDAMGLQQAETLKLDSPFDYAKQTRLFVPRYLPDPKESTYVVRLLEAIMPILAVNSGGSFLLFTSHRALQEAAKLLREQKYEKPLWVQGELNKNELLDRFREAPSLLLGTSSFWEGVDVSGVALTCVVIDRLPFESPGEPILQAKTHAYRKQGKDPFAELQLPRAVISLKQGAGRLIRSETDYGVLVIADHRLVSKKYGSDFLQSLPPFPRTRNLDQVVEFFINNKNNS